ncbi:MAG: YicC family protein [Bacteroides sp.]|nr:YicC family protein [Bacteroidales bacterium]MBD5243392.1 YicC family protein [Barnesiella sp.]MBD5315186.1 YicC family protein [Bacteroides sp.]MDE6249993.1 YicC family protein [Paramuribaculum sp.]MDE7449301.1 YicC family protein [Paramuribaculum sp.]
MLLSMTGFGKAIVEIPNKKITVEIKSLNSKQMDMSMRLPSCYRDKELDLRNRIAHKLERGKVEVNVYLEVGDIDAPVQFNYELMAAYKARIEEMAEKLGLEKPEDWYSLLLRFPDTTKSDVTVTLEQEEVDALFEACDKACDALMDFRRQEGKKLEEFFADRIEHIRVLLTEVPRYETERVTKIRTRIIESLQKLSGIDYDRSRLEQEMIFYIEKLDINEEKQRLAQHLSYFLETMDTRHGQGKKLGFISQEIGREINTLGSKSNHAELQRLVVRMKDELEQIKEQVLNVM